MTIKYLHIFDFDGTLFRSPERPAWWKEKGWWGKHESLGPPCVPEKPGSDWWVESTVSAAKKAISDAESYAVLITGRLAQKFHARVFELLSQVGLHFDETHLTPGGGTLPHKLRVIEDLIKRLPIEKVEIWEDRSEHVGAFKSVIEQFGKESEIHLVSTHAHALECPPPEEGMAERVVARYLAGAAVVIRPGFEWTDQKGRVWEVVEDLSFGRVRVRTKDRSRVGEMRKSEILAEIERLKTGSC